MCLFFHALWLEAYSVPPGNMLEFVELDRAQSLVGTEHDMVTFCSNLRSEKLLGTRHVVCIFRRNASNFCGDVDSLCFNATSYLVQYNGDYPHFDISLRPHIYPTFGVSVRHLLYPHYYCTNYTWHMFHLSRRHLLHPTRKTDCPPPVHGMPLRLWNSWSCLTPTLGYSIVQVPVSVLMREIWDCPYFSPTGKRPFLEIFGYYFGSMLPATRWRNMHRYQERRQGPEAQAGPGFEVARVHGLGRCQARTCEPGGNPWEANSVEGRVVPLCGLLAATFHDIRPSRRNRALLLL